MGHILDFLYHSTAQRRQNEWPQVKLTGCEDEAYQLCLVRRRLRAVRASLNGSKQMLQPTWLPGALTNTRVPGSGRQGNKLAAALIGWLRVVVTAIEGARRRHRARRARKYPENICSHTVSVCRIPHVRTNDERDRRRSSSPTGNNWCCGGAAPRLSHRRTIASSSARAALTIPASPRGAKGAGRAVSRPCLLPNRTSVRYRSPTITSSCAAQPKCASSASAEPPGFLLPAAAAREGGSTQTLFSTTCRDAVPTDPAQPPARRLRDLPGRTVAGPLSCYTGQRVSGRQRADGCGRASGCRRRPRRRPGTLPERRVAAGAPRRRTEQ